jgi:hypothetical protein
MLCAHLVGCADGSGVSTGGSTNGPVTPRPPGDQPPVDHPNSGCAWWQFGGGGTHTGQACSGIADEDFVVRFDTLVDPSAHEKHCDVVTFDPSHRASPLTRESANGDQVFTVQQNGYVYRQRRATAPLQTHTVIAYRWHGSQLVREWSYESDYRMVSLTLTDPYEPIFQPVIVGPWIYVPAARGAIVKLEAETGALVSRIDPLAGTPNAEHIKISGGLVADGAGNVYYPAVAWHPSHALDNNTLGQWLVKVAQDNTVVVRDWSDISPGTPTPTSPVCGFSLGCGNQRPVLNATPALGPSGELVVMSRSHFNPNFGFLLRLDTASMTNTWTASLQNRIAGQSNLRIRGSDVNGSAPVIAPDGSIFIGGYNPDPNDRGLTFKFSPAGDFLAWRPFGWESTPTIWQPPGAAANEYKLIGDLVNPSSASSATSFVVQYNANLVEEWRTPAFSPPTCTRDLESRGVICTSTRPRRWWFATGAGVVDPAGNFYTVDLAGFAYKIAQGGRIAARAFLGRGGLVNIPVPLAMSVDSATGDARLLAIQNGSMWVLGANGDIAVKEPLARDAPNCERDPFPLR